MSNLYAPTDLISIHFVAFGEVHVVRGPRSGPPPRRGFPSKVGVGPASECAMAFCMSVVEQRLPIFVISQGGAVHGVRSAAARPAR